jgi:hypothetical protein
MPPYKGLNFSMGFDARLGWYPIGDALAIVRAVAGSSAWPEMKSAIQHKRLSARCLADGVTRDFEPYWLDFLAWGEPQDNVLWFDREKAWRKGVLVPNRAEKIVVEAANISTLWPGCAAPQTNARTQEGLYDLVARESALRGLPREQLLVAASHAIVNDKLQVDVGEVGLDHRLPQGTTWRKAIAGSIPAIERDPHFFAHWFKQIGVLPSDFHKWLDTETTPSEVPLPLRSSNRLLPAPREELRRALTAEYDAAAKEAQKPPNVREIIAPVQERLRAKGYEASGRQISELAGAEEYKSRRRKPGRTIASEKRRQHL